MLTTTPPQVFQREPLLSTYYRTPVPVELPVNHFEVLLDHFNDFRDIEGNTLLMRAYKKGDEVLTKALLQKKLEYSYLTSSDRHGFSLFLLACQNLDLELMVHLSSRPIDWFDKTEKGDNALMLVCKNPNVQKRHLDFFLGYRDLTILINDQNRKGMSAIHFLLDQNKSDLILYLLGSVININQRIINEIFCFACSKIGLRLDIIKYFLERGANPNFVSDFHFGDTPLSMAIETGNLDLVMVLHEHGADFSQTHSFTDETMIEIACRCRFLDIVNFLYSHL